MLLNLNIVKEAARDLLTAAIMDEIEDRDAHASLPEGFHNPEQLAADILKQDAETVMFIMGKYIGQIGSGWRNDVGLVFHHAGLLEDEESAADALYRLVMSCWGHGVSLDDYYTDSFERAKAVLDKYHPDHPMKGTPTHFDQHESFSGEVVQPRLVYAKRDED